MEPDRAVQSCTSPLMPSQADRPFRNCSFKRVRGGPENVALIESAQPVGIENVEDGRRDGALPEGEPGHATRKAPRIISPTTAAAVSPKCCGLLRRTDCASSNQGWSISGSGMP